MATCKLIGFPERYHTIGDATTAESRGGLIAADITISVHEKVHSTFHTSRRNAFTLLGMFLVAELPSRWWSEIMRSPQLLRSHYSNRKPLRSLYIYLYHRNSQP